MKDIFRNKIRLCIITVIFTNFCIGTVLLTNRSFPRLAVWNISESKEYDDFDWQPEDAPGNFYFEAYSDKLDVFKNEIHAFIKNEDETLQKVLKVAGYMQNVFTQSKTRSGNLKWDSPANMLKQIKQGKRGANCFHWSILFTTYMSSINIKSRLWVLEGDDELGKQSHSVSEVYITELEKWVLIDVMRNVYFRDENNPLSVLELRKYLMNDKADKVLSHAIYRQFSNAERHFKFFTQRVRCVFLRAGNDFVNKYDAKIRYGVFNKSQRYLDRLPSTVRRALDYLLGRRDFLMHYVDEFSSSLKYKIIIAKLFFYFFVITSLFMLGCLLGILLSTCFAINLSKKITRQK